MLKIKIILLTIIILIGSIPFSIANESNICFYTFNYTTDKINIKSIEIPIKFESYEIINTPIGHIINLEDFGQITSPGEPKIPIKIISIAIPKNTKPLKLSYKTKDQQDFNGIYEIKAAPPLIFENENINESLFDEYYENYERLYSSNDRYPENIVSFERLSGFRDYNLIDIKIHPFSYKPLSGRLTFYPNITIIVDYIDIGNTEIKDDLLSSIRLDNLARNIIFNYDQIRSFYTINYINGVHDFVIITLESLKEAVEPLVQWEIEKGRTVKVVTKSWIETEYEGLDLAGKIRNFLRDKYPNSEWGIEDVLIVGHYDDIPLRKVWQGNVKPETDFYYAELSKPDNESWDSNNNQIYGDIRDDIDFYAEVNVGRIPWSDYETVLHICEKSVNFEKNTDPSFKNNILLLAARVDQQTDGAVYTEYIANNTIHPWMDHWIKNRLYERDSIYPMDEILNHMNVISTWTNGKYAFVAWHAHGSPEGSYVGNQAFIHINDCSLLNDEYPAIISAASCSNSDTDYLNIGQAMLKQGAVGFLGANKAAYYCSGWTNPNDGSDQSFKYFFTSSITSGEYTQGEALQYAIKEMYAKGLWTQLYYETFLHSSLWGNPNLGISSNTQNNPPLKPNKPEGPSNIKINQEYTYNCNTTDPDSDQIYYCWSWGDNDVEWVGPYNSGEVVTASHIWTTEGNFEIKVKSKDIYGSESQWSDPLSITLSKNKSKNFISEIIIRLMNNIDIFKLINYINSSNLIIDLINIKII